MLTACTLSVSCPHMHWHTLLSVTESMKWVPDTCLHTRLNTVWFVCVCVWVWVGGGQDKQSSKKHSSDPLSWWVACLDAAPQRQWLVCQKSFPAIMSAFVGHPVLQSLAHWCSCWTFWTHALEMPYKLDKYWHFLQMYIEYISGLLIRILK